MNSLNYFKNFINTIRAKIDNANEIEVCLNFQYSFRNLKQSVEIIFSVRDDKIMEELKTELKKEEYKLEDVSIDVVSRETKEKTIFPNTFKTLIEKKIDGRPILYQPGEELFLFLDGGDVEGMILNFDEMYCEYRVLFLVHIITQVNDENVLISLSDKVNKKYIFSYYNSTMAEIKKYYGITSNFFGFLIGSQDEVKYILKDKSDYANLTSCFKNIKSMAQFKRSKSDIFKPENKIELSKQNIEKIISNLNEIYDKGNKYFKVNSFYYRINSYFKQNEEYSNINYNIQVTSPNQRIFKEFMNFIKPYKEELPDKQSFELIYEVDYRDHADITFKEGKMCNKCQKLITIEDYYYLCYLCKIDKIDYIMCSNCYTDLTQHKHPIVYVPIGGYKYLPDLKFFRSIQLEDDNELGINIAIICDRCGSPMNQLIYYCCQCRRLQICGKCFQDFKNGENYKYYDCKMNEHSEDHPMLICNDQWYCDNSVTWSYFPYYEENSDDKYSYLYEFPTK